MVKNNVKEKEKNTVKSKEDLPKHISFKPRKFEPEKGAAERLKKQGVSIIR